MTSIAQQLTSTQVRGMVAGEQDDLSDVTTHTVTQAASNTDLVNLSAAGYFMGGYVQARDSSADAAVDYTVDGGTTATFSVVLIDDSGGNEQFFVPLVPVRFDSSLVVTLKPGGGASDVISGVGYTL